MRVLRVVLRLFVILLVIGAIILLVGLPLVTAAQLSSTLARPNREALTRSPTDVGVTAWETVRLDTPDGIQLAGWFIPAPATAADGAASNGATVILLHGFGGTRQSMLLQAAVLYGSGYGVLLYDQRAHGESGGDLSTMGYLELGDAFAAIDYLKLRGDVNPQRIGFVGESLGAVVGIIAASHRPDDVRAVVAQSAFVSVEDAIADRVRRVGGVYSVLGGLVAPLTRALFERETGADLSAVNPLDQIYELHPRAVLLMHGDNDPLIAPTQSQRLYDAARDTRELVFVVNGGHGGLLERDPALWRRRVVAFLNTYLRDVEIETNA